MKGHIRIENDSIMGNQTKVFHVAEDGTETDISSVCRDVKVHLSVGEPNTATVELIKVVGSSRADLTEVAIHELRPRRGNWLRSLRDATTFNKHGVREYVR